MNFRKATVLGLLALLLAGCGVSLVPSKDDWYAKHYYIMQDFEWKLYKSLSPAAKLEFQKMFWEVRTPYAKQQFDQRVEYCLNAYKKENSRQPFNVDRAHVYLLNGKPEQIEYKQNDAWVMTGAPGGGGAAGVSDRSGEDVAANMSEVWTYRFSQFLVTYIFTFRQPNEWKLNQTAIAQVAQTGQNRYMGALELQNKNEVYGIDNMDAYKQKLESLKNIK